MQSVGRNPGMSKRPLTGLAVAVAGLALSLAAAAGVASADPDLGPIVNTTCNYGQVMAALNAQNPAAAAQLTASPFAVNYLRNFLASAPSQRLQMARQIQAMPQAAPYFNDVAAGAGSCNNY